MLQQDIPDDFVLATGETHEVKEFVNLSFKELGIEIEWVGNFENEKGINKTDGDVIVEIDKNYYRPTEVDVLIGNPLKAKKKLDWQANTKFEELVKIMTNADFELVKNLIR